MVQIQPEPSLVSPRVTPAAQLSNIEAADPDSVPINSRPPTLAAPAPVEVVKQAAQDVGNRLDDILIFKASLTRDDLRGDLGMTVLTEEGVPGVVVVTGIREGGPITTWNEAQVSRGRADLSIQRGDRILADNGRPREWMLDTGVLQHGTLAIEVQRWPETYQITLKRNTAADKLGMKLELVERAGGLRILRIGAVGGGLLEAYNASAAAADRPHVVVSPGSEVVKVHELTNCPEDMMTVLQEGDVDLTVQRPDLQVVERMAAERACAEASKQHGA